jgi:hypothetical protein
MEEKRISGIPDHAIAFIDLVVKKIRYRKKVRQEVRDELVAHFEDELRGCTNEQDREQKAHQLVTEFGDPKVLAALMRRAKKRCRPLWAKVVVHGLQAIGVVVLYLVICALPQMIGRPTIRINYMGWINDLVRDNQDESLNAKPYYDKAVELAAKAPTWPPELRSRTWPGDMNDQERKATVELLDKSTEALDALREAVGKSYYWVHYELDPNSNRPKRPEDPLAACPKGSLSFSAGLADYAMKPLAGYKDLARRMDIQIHWKKSTGDVEGAIDDTLVLVRFGTHLEGKGTLVEQLVAIAIEALAYDSLLEVLDKSNVPTVVLKRTHLRLDECNSTQKAIISLDVEKALLYEYVQRTFTDDGKGNGRVLNKGIPLVADNAWGTLTRFLSFSLPDRRVVTERINAFFNEYARWMDIPPSSPAFQDQAERLKQIARGNVFLKLEEPAFGRIAQLVWRFKTHRQGVIAVLGIMEYRQEKGDYPSNLNELVAAGYLDKLPIDPYSGGPMVYRRTDGGFLLYSLGKDLKDDGGIQGTNSQGKPRMWRDTGDWVFWPVSD